VNPRQIRRALISVWDKTGIVDFARALHDEFGVEIISTGGTAKTLRDAGIPVTLVETLTGCGEMLDGRVKTLHPAIHAAILADRDNPEHMRQLEAAGIEPIDMVVVNLYPFEKTVADPNCTFEQAIEMIDIGGVALLRAAAKNHQHVLVPTREEDLPAILGWLDEDALSEDGWVGVRRDYAFAALLLTSTYDATISTWLSAEAFRDGSPLLRCLHLLNWGPLRYGENPHQAAELLQNATGSGIDLTTADSDWSDTQPALSYNNYLDADAALGLCAELARSAAMLNSERPLSQGGSGIGVSPVPGTPLPNAKPGTSQSVEPANGRLPLAESVATPKSGFAARRRPIDDETVFRRNLPHIQRPGASYFVTFRVAHGQGALTPAERDIVMDCCLFPDGKLYRLHACVCMPDHVHLLLTPLEHSPGQWHSLSEVTHSVKGNIGRLVAEHRKRPGPVLQPESFDHIVRNRDDLLETIEYIRGNPRRKRLDSSGPYPWLVLETQPDWDSSTRAAGLESQHELWAVRLGERAWYSRLAGGVRETPLRKAGAPPLEGGGGAEENRPLAGSTLSDKATRVAACVFIKHTNACGVGVADDPIEAYRAAYLGDPNAAMGGVLAVNFRVDAEFAAAVMETYDRFGRPLKDAGATFAPGGFFVEVWVAPSFDDAAIDVIRGTAVGAPKKKWGENVRLLAVGDMNQPPDPNALQYRSIAGGMLVQSPDVAGLNEAEWKVVTKRAPTGAELADLRLAWLICKHTKSNAISIVKEGMLIGNGAGQMSRVMSCRIATWLARENGHADALPGSVAASDAFFPFADGPQLLIDAGVTALIQPGGSKRDQETIDLCDERGVAMILSGTRHFRH
jgi:AICAR transformylase/IMP cyclohydrolase PurH/REP element-mobilizing transposase RayT